MASSPTRVDDSIAALPEHRLAVVQAVRKETDRRLPKGCKEGIRHARIGRYVHRELCAAGKKLDMGKSSVRFERLDDLPLERIGEAVTRVPVATYPKQHEASGKSRARRAKA